MKRILILLSVFLSVGFAQNISQDSVFVHKGVTLRFPSNGKWIVGIIELNGSDDSSYVQKMPYDKITVFPADREVHAHISIHPNEYKLNVSFKRYTELIQKEFFGLDIVSTKTFEHDQFEAFEIFCRWKELGSPVYSFQRIWYINYEDLYVTILRWESDENTYNKYNKTAEKIMKSVQLMS